MTLAVLVTLGLDKGVNGWGCSKCGREETASPNLPEDRRRRERNCDATTNTRLVKFGRRIEQCPWSLQPETWRLAGWWADWKLLGVLPCGGSDLMEQPAYVKEAFEIAERTLNEERRKMEREAGRG